MTIEYALTRLDIVRGYFCSIWVSPRFFITILVYGFASSGFFLFAAGAFSRPLGKGDAITAVLAFVGFQLFMPAFLFIRAKTAVRTLTILPAGLDTRIGEIHAQREWSQIKVVKRAKQFVLIASASGNAFLIPARAFPEPEQMDQFVMKANNWIEKSKRTN